MVFNGTLPLEGTDLAGSWDSLYWFLIWLSVFLFVLVIGAMIYFAVKHRGPDVKTKYLTHSTLLEVVWITIPTILLMVIFGWGYAVYHRMVNAPSDAYEINVIAKQWLWTFQYDTGKVSVSDLYVPINRPVKLIMTSQDVIHSFFVPNFRIKQDVVPGMYTSVWFEAKIPGKQQIFCAEYCGTSHSGMLGKVVVLTDPQWNDFLHDKPLGPIPEAGMKISAADVEEARLQGGEGTHLSLAEQGKKLAETKGCVACHTVDGTVKVGPSWKGVFDSTVELADGSTVHADANYLRESIDQPNAKIVKGFQPVMPTFQGLVNETEMNALIAYIKSLK